MADYLFFRTSRSAYKQITELFDFVTPTAAALWNLRWQVTGFRAQNPNATVELLHERFVSGSGLHGANLQRACIDTTWEEQQRQFAKFLLISLFSIYESWLSDALQVIAPAAKRKGLSKSCQYPDSVATKGEGVRFAINTIKITPSPMLVNAFYNSLKKHRKNGISEIENLLLCYRAFKEARNSWAHQNGLAIQASIDAYMRYAPLSALNLNVKEKPEFFPVTVGKAVPLSLRGVIGFSDIILRIIATLDAEFSCAQLAEDELREQWAEKHSVNGKVKRIQIKTAGTGRRERQLARIVAKLGLPRPSQTSQIDTYLKAAKYIF